MFLAVTDSLVAAGFPPPPSSTSTPTSSWPWPRLPGTRSVAAAELVSWFYLTLQLPDSPVVADLGLADRDLAGRIAGLIERLGRGTDEVAPRLLEAAPLLEGLLRALAEGRAPDLARLAALWPSLEVPPAESEEDGAGGSLGLAFGGAIDLGDSGGFIFADLLQPDVFKITDQDARVRSGPPAFGMITSKVAYGTAAGVPRDA